MSCDQVPSQSDRQSLSSQRVGYEGACLTQKIKLCDKSRMADLDDHLKVRIYDHLNLINVLIDYYSVSIEVHFSRQVLEMK